MVLELARPSVPWCFAVSESPARTSLRSCFEGMGAALWSWFGSSSGSSESSSSSSSKSSGSSAAASSKLAAARSS